jgi:hypothetical protein
MPIQLTELKHNKMLLDLININQTELKMLKIQDDKKILRNFNYKKNSIVPPTLNTLNQEELVMLLDSTNLRI